MHTFREHIIYKFSIVILVAALLTPSFVKLFHIFENHEHAICVNQQDTHFHKVDLDCEFYKFKLNTRFSPLQHAVELLVIEDDYHLVRNPTNHTQTLWQ